MKIISPLICFMLIGSFALAQQSYKPKKRKKDFFGKENPNNRQVGNLGMHLSVGPTFSVASDNREQSDIQISDNNGNIYDYDITQKGKIGGHIGLGLNYFNKKSGWFSFGRLIDYYELGARFSYFRGIEKTSLTDANNRDAAPIQGQGDYSSGLLSGHFGIHKILSIPQTKLFLDNGLSVAVNYRLLSASNSYSNFIPSFAHYSPSLTSQINYSLGIGFQLKKGSYLIPGVTVPVFSFQEMAKQSVYWFSSRYYPVICEIKWVYRFNKARSKTGCATPDRAPIPTPEGAK